jgi:hypothetical protein
MPKRIRLALLSLCACAALAGPALARDFRDHDIHRFHEHDIRVWHGGGWHHDFHGGRLGWWWVVGPHWYFYNAPIYPYPDPYVPPVVIVQPPPATGVPHAQSWYYCDDPQGYYPYVNECRGPWRAVPTSPPGAQ